MSVLIKLSNLSVANSSLPALDVTSDDIELASLPQLTFWLQAGAKFKSGNVIRERAQGRTIRPTVTSSLDWQNGQFTNGADALIVDNNSSHPYLLDDDYHVNKNAWTMAFVFERSADDVGNAYLTGGVVTQTPEMKQLFIAMTDAGLKLYSGDTSPRIQDPIVGKYVGVTLAIVSFSTTNGLTMRINGEEVAREAADKAPLTDGRFRLLASSNNTVGANTSALGGKIGTIMSFDADLCLPSYRLSLDKLESMLMTRYGITTP